MKRSIQRWNKDNGAMDTVETKYEGTFNVGLDARICSGV